MTDEELRQVLTQQNLNSAQGNLVQPQMPAMQERMPMMGTQIRQRPMIPLQGYQAPEGIKEGVTNFVQNALLTPIKEGLYLEEGPKRYGQRLSNNLKAQEINLYNAQLDRRDNLIRTLSDMVNPEMAPLLPNMSYEDLSDLLGNLRGRAGRMPGAAPGTIGQQNLLTNEVSIISQATENEKNRFAAGGDAAFRKRESEDAAALEIAKQDAEISKIEGRNRQQRYADNYTSRMGAWDNARTQIRDVMLLQQLIGEGIDTGYGTELMMSVRNVAGSLGFEVDSIADQELFGAITRRMALALRNPAGGAGMPGSMSDSDREYLNAMIAGLEKTEGGNAIMLKVMEAQLRRDMKLGEMADEWMDKNGTYKGFRKEAQAYSDANPMFESLKFEADALIARNNAAKEGGFRNSPRNANGESN
jgi:hypothetical protein